MSRKCPSIPMAALALLPLFAGCGKDPAPMLLDGGGGSTGEDAGTDVEDPIDGGSGRLFHVAPDGAGSECSAASPCSLAGAQAAVRAAAPAMDGDLVVTLAGGVYPVSAPLVFTTADSGRNGHRVRWEAAPGARPVISGATTITGWTLDNVAKGIWKAAAPGGFATRQLFVDGKLATRARHPIPREDFTVTAAGFSFTKPGLDFLHALAHPERVDLHSIGSFTDRYSKVEAIADHAATMVQPAWAHNNWGYDTIERSFRQGPVYLENALEFLDEPGEWYLDTTANALYYKPLPGQDMATADVRLPRLEVLLSIGGTHDQPAHDLTFQGIAFSHTSWLGPNSPDGYANQQTGAFIVGAKSLYPEFEATRPRWHQMPAAIQVSAAKNITFLRDRFTALGQVALGIGNDDNAHASTVGLGANAVLVEGCVFTQTAGGAIVIGGIQEKAHHPGGDVDPTALPAEAQRLVNQHISIRNNLIHHVAIDYRDFAAVMFTYSQHVEVAHNEIHDFPYSGINSGYGWGVNDAGGNREYKTRQQGNLYDYQPLFRHGTIAMNNFIGDNHVHHGMLQMNDGGCLYNLSANPGTVATRNYCDAKGSGLSGSYVGVYEDEGSAYRTVTRNVFAGFGTVVTANANDANNTGYLTFTDNWISGPANPVVGGPGNTIAGNIPIDGTQIPGFPAEAQAVANAAGLEPAFADLSTAP